MTTKRVIASCILLFFSFNFAFAQQANTGKSSSHKYRTLLTIVGGAGGVVVGLLMSLSVFDDAINSERKGNITMALTGTGGAVGGYFLGRMIDKNKTAAKAIPTADLRFSNYLYSKVQPKRNPLELNLHREVFLDDVKPPANNSD
jgi:hypothetical protein